MAISLNNPAQSPKRIFAATTKNGELELLVYDYIGDSGWGGGVTAEAVKRQLEEAGEVSKITLRINSPGGDVFEASAIYSLLIQHKAKVECYVDGLAASAAFTIAMAGDSIHISESAMMMCHNSLGACMGYASDMRQMADLLDKVSGTMRDIYANKSGMKADEVQALMDAETWMTAAEAVEYGFADDVIKRDAKDEEEAKALAAAFDLSKFKFKANPRGKEDAKPVAPPDNPAATVPPPVVPPVNNEVDESDKTECQCACAECKAGNCTECSDADCKDPNCNDGDEDDQAKAAADAAEVEMLREEFAFLSI